MDNYSDPEFNIEKLVQNSYVSRTVFYHKIKAGQNQYLWAAVVYAMRMEKVRRKNAAGVPSLTVLAEQVSALWIRNTSRCE